MRLQQSIMMRPLLLIMLLSEIPAVVGQDHGALSTAPRLEEQRQNVVSSFPDRLEGNNLDLVEVEGEDDLAFCNLVDLNLFGSAFGPFLEFALEAMAAMELAVEHLNTGNGVVVKEVEGLNERCKIRFTTEHVDTQGAEEVAVDQLVQILQREQGLPCAFIGAFKTPVSVATSLLTSLKGYPHFNSHRTRQQGDLSIVWTLSSSQR